MQMQLPGPRQCNAILDRPFNKCHPGTPRNLLLYPGIESSNHAHAPVVTRTVECGLLPIPPDLIKSAALALRARRLLLGDRTCVGKCCTPLGIEIVRAAVGTPVSSCAAVRSEILTSLVAFVEDGTEYPAGDGCDQEDDKHDNPAPVALEPDELVSNGDHKRGFRVVGLEQHLPLLPGRIISRIRACIVRTGAPDARRCRSSHSARSCRFLDRSAR